MKTTAQSITFCLILSVITMLCFFFMAAMDFTHGPHMFIVIFSLVGFAIGWFTKFAGITYGLFIAGLAAVLDYSKVRYFYSEPFGAGFGTLVASYYISAPAIAGALISAVLKRMIKKNKKDAEPGATDNDLHCHGSCSEQHAPRQRRSRLT